jgi:hypothetical protein
VIYYSRIRNNDEFQERLVACLVENEEAEDRLQRGTKTGIAWWGTQEGRPLTEPRQIEDVCTSLGIRQFKGTETGTSILIPFLRADLAPEADPQFDEDTGLFRNAEPLPWWYRSYEDYLKVSLQRWFCARIDNPWFRGGPMLVASVNGRPLRVNTMMPVFQVLQALYNRLGGNEPPADDFLTRNRVEATSILKIPISLNNTFRGTAGAGTMAAVLLTPAQMQMGSPENHADPFLHLFGRSEPEGPHRPLFAFIRRPGMIIRWDDSGDIRGWGGGLPGPVDGRFLVALFVPDQDRLLAEVVTQKLRIPTATLESYLRGCEKADHHQWNDQAGFTIIRRIRSRAGKQLREFCAGHAPQVVQSPALRMARNLADKLLPRGFGFDGRRGPAPYSQHSAGERTGRGLRNSFSSNLSLEISAVHHEADGVRISWTLHWGSGNIPRRITLEIDAEPGSYSENHWCEEGLGAFPLRIAAVRIADNDSPDSTIHSSGIVTLRGTEIRLVPWKDPMDGVRISGEMKIEFCEEIGRSLRPVLKTLTANLEKQQQ